jgi:hypothetical protein
LLDLERQTFEYRRVPYDVAATQQKIILAGLPWRLAMRLERGY